MENFNRQQKRQMKKMGASRPREARRTQPAPRPAKRADVLRPVPAQVRAELRKVAADPAGGPQLLDPRPGHRRGLHDGHHRPRLPVRHGRPVAVRPMSERSERMARAAGADRDERAGPRSGQR
jgi:hypothetical protein